MSFELTQASDLASFLDSAVSPAHAVYEVTRRLRQANFQPLDERSAWSFQPGQRSFVTRGTGSIIAFEAGQAPPSEAGFLVIGAHTDSPNLRLRPKFGAHAQGHALLSVEPYGSPLLHTWLDRDLCVAGTLVVAQTGPILFRCLEPVARISSLAIHFNRDVNQQGLKLDAQTQLRATVALEASETERSPLWTIILADLGKRLGRNVELGEVLAFDLGLFDEQGTRFVGANRELLTSGRLDNLASCHGAVTALLSAASIGAATRVIVLYDHEEVGSRSSSGAQSPLLSDVLGRIAAAAAPLDREAFARALARSLLLSADMAHAVHPNYSDKHDEEHRPRLGGGPGAQDQRQSILLDGHRRHGGRRECIARRQLLAAKVRVAQRHPLRQHDWPDCSGSHWYPHSRHRRSAIEHALMPRSHGRSRHRAQPSN